MLCGRVSAHVGVEGGEEKGNGVNGAHENVVVDEVFKAAKVSASATLPVRPWGRRLSLDTTCFLFDLQSKHHAIGGDQLDRLGGRIKQLRR